MATQYDISKLPKWARDRIERAERQIRDLEASIGEPSPGTRITKGRLVSRGMTPVAVAENRDTIDFRLDPPTGWHLGDKPPSISVRFEQLLLNETDFGSLDIRTADGRLIVFPTSSNAVCVRAAQF